MSHRAQVMAVHAIMVRSDVRSDEVLLIRRSGTGHEDGNYGLAGGRLEDGETVAQAAARECWEEVGVRIEPSDLDVVGVARFVSASGEGVDFFVTTRHWMGEAYPKSECDDVRWCAPGALPANTIPFVRRAIEHHLLAGRWFDEIDF